jgi:hypothetical protein
MTRENESKKDLVQMALETCDTKKPFDDFAEDCREFMRQNGATEKDFGELESFLDDALMVTNASLCG